MENKKKYKELIALINQMNFVIGKAETKVQKKLQKIYEKVKSHHESYNAQREELRLDNAATDDKGVLLTDEKGEYKFNKEGVKKLTKDIETLNEKEFEFKPIEVVNTQGLEDLHFLEEWTSGITFNEKEAEEEL
jgi:hypothetical protein